MLNRLLLIISLFSFVFLFVGPMPAHAQANSWGNCVINNVPSLTCLPIVFSNIIKAALMFVGTVAIILIIYAGIRFVTSGGDPKQSQAARQIMTYAIIGLILVLSSFAIIYLIAYLTGATCIEQLSFTSCK
ncbi:MAG TPA: hypothetical protein VNW29_05155 [Candidatus Sulfotelmatobacter sp.]|jgi:hypothetical protein|nr:hypothetical protein [Candidatus Sulfotelmatobacter sp.]